MSLWLFFGSLAFFEQMNLLVETSSQDEAVLSQLASTLKHDVPTLEGRLIRSATAIVTVPLSLDLTVPVSQSVWIPVSDLTALRPHQRVSVYRI